MRHMGRWLGVILIGTVLGPPTASACVCGPKPSVHDEFAAAKAVFVGRVIARRPVEKDLGGKFPWPGFDYEFVIERAWKGVSSPSKPSWNGDSGPRVVVWTGSGGGDCGYPFEIGKTYLVYAYGTADLATSICGRTAPVAWAGVDLVVLDQAPRDPVSVATAGNVSVLAAVVSGAGALIAFGIGVAAGQSWSRRKPDPVHQADLAG